LIIWEKNEELYAPFSALFKPMKGIKVITTTPFLTKIVYYLFSKVFRFKIYNKKYILKYFKRTSNINEIFFINTNSIVETDIDFFLPEFKVTDFKLVDNINQTVCDFVFQNNISEAIGIHIRRTDNVVAIRNSPISLFYTEMDNEIRINDKIKFFVASDDDTVVNELKLKYPQRIFTFATNKTRNHQDGIEQATAELFILSKSKKIYGTYWSSFSEMAIQLNNNIESKLLNI
jgi:hypothetical protein